MYAALQHQDGFTTDDAMVEEPAMSLHSALGQMGDLECCHGVPVLEGVYGSTQARAENTDDVDRVCIEVRLDSMRYVTDPIIEIDGGRALV